MDGARGAGRASGGAGSASLAATHCPDALAADAATAQSDPA
ncbi:hypothetical protein ABZX40_24440 [Streptomyces sp. NPDC004610]